MTTPRAGHVRPLGETDRADAERFLLQSPVENLFLLGVIEEHGMLPGFFGTFELGALRAVLFVAGGKSAVPYVPRAATFDGWRGMAELVRGGGRIVGAADAVAPLWKALRERLGDPSPVIDRAQRLYALERGGVRARVTRRGDLRPAVPREVDAVLRAHSMMVEEDEGYDPSRLAPERFRRSIASRVERGRVYVVVEGGEVVFKVDLSARGRHGAQFAGVFTHPDHRRRGLARQSLAELAVQLFADSPRVTLHVNNDNLPAVRTYESVGFKSAMDFRMVVLGY